MKLLKLTHLILFLVSLKITAGENAAPSSHMVYNDASFPGDILINEVRVPKKGEAMYTYYAVSYTHLRAHET